MADATPPQARGGAGTMVARLLEAGAQRLERAGSTSARFDALLLLEHATGLGRATLLAHPERAIHWTQEAVYDKLLARREAAEPIAYILGQREFYGRTFRVDPRVLIPRPETEMLVSMGVQAARAWHREGVEPRIVDVGTGSGAIAISIAAETDLRVVATDRSRDALALAKQNAEALGVHALVRFVQSDLLGGLRGPIHVLIANLPYVPTGRELPRDVAGYEPHGALFAGPRGTELIERLLYEARSLLAPGAEVLVELDEQAQARSVAAHARNLYPGEVEILPDSAGLDRVVRIALER